MSQLANTTGLAATCFATTDHTDGLAVCALIDGHSGEHVDGTKQFAWSEDDCRGGMVLVSYMVCAIAVVVILCVALVIKALVTA